MDRLAVVHIRSLFSSPTKVAEVLGGGFNAIKSALSSLSRDDPDVAAGINMFGSSLLEVISGLLPADVKGSTQFTDFETKWSDALALVQVAADMRPELDSWGKDGKIEDIVLALSTALDLLAGVAQTSSLPEAGLDIAKLLFGLKDSLQGAGEGIVLLEEGDQLGGVRAVYDGLKAAVDDLVPGDLMNDDTYAIVVNGASGQLGGVIRDLLEHVQQVVSAAVCWKRTMMRARSRPSVCDQGFTLAENQWCLPSDGALGLARRARCPAAAEVRGSWCYHECEPGYSHTHLHCKQACLGQYHIDSPLLCGNREGSVAFALVEIVAKTAFAAATQVGLAEIVAHAGLVLASQMTDVVQAFVDFAKPFGHPNCPDAFGDMGHGSLR